MIQLEKHLQLHSCIEYRAKRRQTVNRNAKQKYTFTELEVLYANDNLLTDISTLNTFSSLKAINVSNNNITSLSVLRNYKTRQTTQVDRSYILSANSSSTTFLIDLSFGKSF